MAMPYIPGTKAHQTYKLKDGTKVPGASTVAKYADAYDSARNLNRWHNNLGLEGIDSSKYLDKLAGVGTCLHAMVLLHLQGKRSEFQELFDQFDKWSVETARECFVKFDKFAIDYEFEPIIMEVELVSEEYCHGGTLDFYGNVRRKGGTWRRKLIDYKTSKGIFDSHWYQTAGYEQVAYENGYKSDEICILRLSKNPKEGFDFKEKEVADMVEGQSEVLPYWRVYQKALEMYWAIKNLRGTK